MCLVIASQQPAAPLTAQQRLAQRAAPHINSAICALVFGILFAIQFLVAKDIVPSIAIFFPLSTACLLKAVLEAKLAYDIYQGRT